MFIVKARINQNNSPYIKLCELAKCPTEDELKLMYYRSGVPGSASPNCPPTADGLSLNGFEKLCQSYFDKLELLKISHPEQVTENYIVAMSVRMCAEISEEISEHKHDLRPSIIVFEVPCGESAVECEAEYLFNTVEQIEQAILLQIKLGQNNIQIYIDEAKAKNEAKAEQGKRKQITLMALTIMALTILGLLGTAYWLICVTIGVGTFSSESISDPIKVLEPDQPISITHNRKPISRPILAPPRKYGRK